MQFKTALTNLFLISTMTTCIFADVFMTELTDPQNSSDAGRYVELYNNGDTDVDLSVGWTIQRWTNANPDPTSSSIKDLTGTIAAGGFYIICNDEDKFSATYGLTCDQDIGTGGAADSNGDDNMAILLDGVIVDMFGVAGEDGSGTGHEFEDGRAERAEGVSAANATWDETEWNIDNDSGGGDGPQYAPEDFDPFAWIGSGGGGGGDTCEDVSACNFGAEGDCEYPDAGYDCDGNCIEEVDCLGVCGGAAVEDCTGACDGDAVVDACGECGGDNSSCSVNVTFYVDMSIEGVIEGNDIKVRTSTFDGEYNPSDWYIMTDNGDGTYSHALLLLTGVTYGYNFNNSDGSGYESGSGLGDCAGGNYGNDRYVIPGDSDMILDTVCWESCDACPEDIPGCMDPDALNYDPSATVDDGSCFYEWPELSNLFFSEAAEGSSNNKYLEIYNASDSDVDLSGYSLSSCSNGCDDGISWDYPDNITFDSGTLVSSGDVYVVCHGSADEIILAECDQTFTYLSNGDDVFALTQIGSGTILDIIGTIGDDPGSGWEVAGVFNATKDHTIVRKSSIESGNGGDWESSAGTDADNSEWVVFDQNTWVYLGIHPHYFVVPEIEINSPSGGDEIFGTSIDVIVSSVNTVDGDHYHADLDGNSAGMYYSDSFTIVDVDAGSHTLTVTIADGGHIEYDNPEASATISFTNAACINGDVNGDDLINVLDVVMVIDVILGNTLPDDNFMFCADMNGDGEINVLDVVQIIDIILEGI